MATRLKKLGALTAAGVLLCGLVATYEGLRTKAYLDPVGIPTICYGETYGVRLGQIKTRQECDEMLLGSLAKHEAGMRKCMDDPDGLAIEPYIAFLDFSYNVGVGAFCQSTLLRYLNHGDIEDACKELLKWTKAKVAGKMITLNGLVKRRQAEYELCMKGV